MKRPKPQAERTVHVEVGMCPAHNFYAVFIDDTRITPSKCCGSWKPIREWDVQADKIEALVRKP